MISIVYVRRYNTRTPQLWVAARVVSSLICPVGTTLAAAVAPLQNIMIVIVVFGVRGRLSFDNMKTYFVSSIIPGITTSTRYEDSPARGDILGVSSALFTAEK